MALPPGENLLGRNVGAREHVAKFPEGACGEMVADIVAIIGSLDVVLGEIDR